METSHDVVRRLARLRRRRAVLWLLLVLPLVLCGGLSLFFEPSLKVAVYGFFIWLMVAGGWSGLLGFSSCPQCRRPFYGEFGNWLGVFRSHCHYCQFSLDY